MFCSLLSVLPWSVHFGFGGILRVFFFLVEQVTCR